MDENKTQKPGLHFPFRAFNLPNFGFFSINYIIDELL